MAPVNRSVTDKGNLMKQSSRCYLLIAVLASAALVIPASAQLSTDEIKGMEQAAPAKATAIPKQQRTLLVFNLSEGFKHGAIERASRALEVIGKKTGAFETVQSVEMSVFRPENLARFDAVCFNNTTQLKFDDPALRKSLLDFVASGKGIIGIHAATDNFPTWPEGQALFGGVFDGHPWTADGTWDVKIVDPTHTLNAAFQGKDFPIKDEIYRVRQMDLRKNSRVLLGLDMKSERNRKANGVRRTDRDIPISWVRAYGKGRLFYCSLGHNHEVYANPAVLRHYLDGIQFALGDLTVDTTPVPFDPMSFFNQDSLASMLRRISAYQYGDSRAAMADLNEFIRDVDDLPAVRDRTENLFLQFLGGDATLAGKQFICTRLAVIGSEASVPRLSMMLLDSATTDMALFAMESIEGSKVDEALLRALPTSKVRTIIGIISALRNRRVQSATSVLRPLVAHPDSALATVAVSALGNIGTLAALEALESSKQSIKPQVRSHLQDALLVCADHLCKEANKDRGLAVYKELNVDGESIPIRSAALRGTILADPGNAAALISKTLRSKDTELHPTVVQLVREMSGIENVRAIARTFPDLPPAGQAQLIASLAHQRDAEIQKIVVEAASSKNPDVRGAALRTLGRSGDATVVALLADAASSQGPEQKEARASLYELNAPGVEDAIIAALPRAEARVKVELIKAIAERKMSSATPLLLQTAKDPSAPVRIESARVLKVLAGADQLPAMVGFLAIAKDETERRDLEMSVVATARRIPNPAKQDEAVLAVYNTIKKRDTRTSFISVLGKIGAPASLPVLCKALGDKNAEIRLAAIRALSEWPTAEPYPNLWKVVKTAKERTHRALALRGSVRLIGLETKRSGDETIKMFREAMKIAPNKDELKLLLSAVGEAPSLAAFQLAASYLKDKNLRQEAEAAVVNIGEWIIGSAGAAIIPDLKQVAQFSQNETVVSRAQGIIRSFERLEDYITAWEIAGPYTKENADLFAESFAPEGPDASKVRWRPFRSMTDQNRLWLLDFDKVVGGNFKVVYVRTNVWSPADQKARMEVGSEDGMKIWLNGELVHAKDVRRGVSPGEDVVQVALRQGWNSLMMKINNGLGGWGACARFRSPDGGRLDGIRVSLNKDG